MSSETGFNLSATQCTQPQTSGRVDGSLRHSCYTRRQIVCSGKQPFSRRNVNFRTRPCGGKSNKWHRSFGSLGIGAGAGGIYLFSGWDRAYANSVVPLAPGKVRRREKRGKRVMILMSDTGGGHRASAQALKAGFKEMYGDKYEVDIVDIWSEHTPWPCNTLPTTYSFMVKHAVLWWLMYHWSNPRVIRGTLNRMMYCAVSRQLSKAFEEYDPDLVVSVHPLMQWIPVRVLRNRERQGLQDHVNFATVVTDLTTCHNTWFDHAVTKCFVPTTECKQLALANGLKESQIVQHGLPIRPEFSHKYASKSTLRKRLGLKVDLKTVLLVGGGEGMGLLEKTVDAMADRAVQGQVVVVCGRNNKLKQKLAAKGYPEGMRVVVLGFVDNMAEWMSAADAIITKAGPGTISEALICGLPILLNGNVPCQEEGNIPYVIDHKVGTLERNPGKAADIIKQWFENGSGELQQMSARARALGKPDALFQIVKDLAKLVK